jgi:RNA polymerase sigma-70 factor (ECF subfamily)
MIKITPLTDEGDGVTRLRVDGRILSKTTDALERACRAGLGGRWPLLLDLSGVSFVDADGAVLLTTLVGRGAVVIGASPFVSEFLRSATQSEGDESARGGDGDPDATLVARLRRGDDDAFDEMSRRFAPRMLAVARRMLRSDEDARDAVQEAFVSAFKSLDRFEGHAKLSTWLHRIVVNAALMRIRTRQRRPEQSIEPLLPTFQEDGHHTDPVVSWAESGDVALERQETRALVRAAIADLPESHRVVLMLRDIEDLSTKAAADALGITENAVKLRLHRARQALATCIKQRLAASGRRAGAA